MLVLIKLVVVGDHAEMMSTTVKVVVPAGGCVGEEGGWGIEVDVFAAAAGGMEAAAVVAGFHS